MRSRRRRLRSLRLHLLPGRGVRHLGHLRDAATYRVRQQNSIVHQRQSDSAIKFHPRFLVGGFGGNQVRLGLGQVPLRSQNQRGCGSAESVFFLFGIKRLLRQCNGGLRRGDACAVLLHRKLALRTSMRTWFSSCCNRICAWRYSSSARTWLACAARLRRGIFRDKPAPLSGAVESNNWQRCRRNSRKAERGLSGSLAGWRPRNAGSDRSGTGWPGSAHRPSRIPRSKRTS